MNDAIQILESILGESRQYDGALIYISEYHCKALEMAIDALKQSKWIPCTERLPEVGQKVVVCELSDIVSVCRLMESEEGELFWKDDNCRWCVYENYTEWIPLPEPFKKECGEDEMVL